MATDPKVPPSILAAIMNQPNALTRMPMPPANTPRVPLPMPQPPVPQKMAQLSLGGLLPGYGDGSRMWSIIDSTGAQTGVLHKPSTPFSTWNVLIGPAGKPGAQQFNFHTKAQALAYMGITE